MCDYEDDRLRRIKYYKLEGLTDSEVVDHIIFFNKYLKDCWENAGGWTPTEVEELFKKSRLDRQVSLSYCLKIWLNEPTKEEEEGRLILAWANLGSLIEGTMKFFLTIYYEDYKNDPVTNTKKGEKFSVELDKLNLEQLKNFYRNKEIDLTHTKKWFKWIEDIGYRRNAIHAYKDRDIGTFTDFFVQIRKYYQFLVDIDQSIPYPG